MPQLSCILAASVVLSLAQETLKEENTSKLGSREETTSKLGSLIAVTNRVATIRLEIRCFSLEGLQKKMQANEDVEKKMV